MTHINNGVSLVRWDGPQLVQELGSVMQIYAEAMHYPPSVASWRSGQIAAHTQWPGFCAVASVYQGQPVGFGYGYRSSPGQWWHDEVVGAMAMAGFSDDAYWLNDCFELVELHVRPAMQGQGLGEQQLRMLLANVAQHTVVLSTPEVGGSRPEMESRAWRLYRRNGFVDLVRRYYFMNDARPFAILGRELPLP